MLYLFFVAIILGINFGIDFLSDMKEKLIHSYGNITTPTLIITTIFLFVPFCFSVFFSVKANRKDIEEISEENIVDLYRKIGETNDFLLRSDCSSEISDKTKELEQEIYRLKLTLGDIFHETNAVNYRFTSINDMLNNISIHTTLTDEYDFTKEMEEYEKSIDRLREIIRNA